MLCRLRNGFQNVTGNLPRKNSIARGFPVLFHGPGRGSHLLTGGNPVAFPELLRCRSFQRTEAAVEVGQVVKPAVKSDVGYGAVIFEEKAARFPDAKFMEVLNERFSCVAFEEAAERFRAHFGDRGDSL